MVDLLVEVGGDVIEQGTHVVGDVLARQVRVAEEAGIEHLVKRPQDLDRLLL